MVGLCGNGGRTALNDAPPFSTSSNPASGLGTYSAVAPDSCCGRATSAGVIAERE